MAQNSAQTDQIISKADRLCAKKKYHEAIKTYQQALQQGAENATIFHNLSVLYTLTNDHQKSIEACQNALRFEPTIERCNYLAQDLSASNKIQQGIDFFSSLEHPLKHYGLALCYFTQNDAAHFMQEIEKGIHFFPEVAAFYKILGRFYYQNNEFNGSLKVLEKALQLDSSDIDILVDLGNTLLQLNKNDVATRSYQMALQQDGNNPYIYTRILRSIIESPKKFTPDTLTSIISHGLERNLLDDQQTLSIFKHKKLYTDIESRFMKRMKAIRFDPPEIKKIILQNTLPDLNTDTCALKQDIEALQNIALSQKEALPLEKVYTKDVIWLPRPNYSIDYYGLDEQLILKLKEAFSQLYARPHRSKCSTKKTHRIGIYCDRSLTLFIKHFHRLLEQWDDTTYSITLISFIEYKPGFDLFKKQHPNTDQINFLPIYKDRGVKFNFDLINGQFDLIYYFEFNTNLFNYFIPMLKPAPIQCTGHGTCHSTGLPEMDYFLVPAHTQHTENFSAYYTEQPIFVDHLFLTPRDPSTHLRPASRAQFDLPEDRNLYLCHHRHIKFTPEFIHALKAICEKDPHATLLLTVGDQCHIHQTLDHLLRKELQSHYTHHILYLPYIERDPLLELTSVTTLMLDSFFFGAGTTTLEAISVGTPIVTLPDAERTQATHFTHYLYTIMEVDDVIQACVAHDINDYVEKSVQLAQNPHLQATLKEQLLANKHKIFDRSEGLGELKRTLVELADQHQPDALNT